MRIAPAVGGEMTKATTRWVAATVSPTVTCRRCPKAAPTRRTSPVSTWRRSASRREARNRQGAAASARWSLSRRRSTAPSRARAKTASRCQVAAARTATSPTKRPRATGSVRARPIPSSEDTSASWKAPPVSPPPKPEAWRSGISASRLNPSVMFPARSSSAASAAVPGRSETSSEKSAPTPENPPPRAGPADRGALRGPSPPGPPRSSSGSPSLRCAGSATRPGLADTAASVSREGVPGSGSSARRRCRGHRPRSGPRRTGPAPPRPRSPPRRAPPLPSPRTRGAGTR